MNRQQFCTIYPDENGVIFEIMAYYNLMEEKCRQRVAAYLKANPQKRIVPGSVVKIPIDPETSPGP
jgi:hypothetical protein